MVILINAPLNQHFGRSYNANVYKPIPSRGATRIFRDGRQLSVIHVAPF